MALNQIERAILTAARQYIADGREERICHAINRASDMLMNSAPQVRRDTISDSGCRLRIFIMRAIREPSGKSRFGLEDWVAAEIGDAVYEDAVGDYLPKMRRTRMAWIDWLLDEPWTKHNGGAQPLLDGEKVIVRLRNGEERGHNGSRLASHGRWCHAAGPIFDAWAKDYDIVAYKVIYEAPCTC
jgi:hypothetical protein